LVEGLPEPLRELEQVRWRVDIRQRFPDPEAPAQGAGRHAGRLVHLGRDPDPDGSDMALEQAISGAMIEGLGQGWPGQTQSDEHQTFHPLLQV
jgi:hypothetical protein